MEHRQLLDLAQKHFSGVSGAYAEDAVPTLAPCRFTGSQVGCPGPWEEDLHLMHTGTFPTPECLSGWEGPGLPHKPVLTLVPPSPLTPWHLPGRPGRWASLSLAVPVSDFPP